MVYNSQSIEALYTIEFGDVASRGFVNGGIVVLETNRIFGGDSGYFYIGNFQLEGSKFTATAKITKHNPNWANAFGDAKTEFSINMSGERTANTIQGHMTRTDIPGRSLPIRLTRKSDLP